jgi:hypothetical protein
VAGNYARQGCQHPKRRQLVGGWGVQVKRSADTHRRDVPNRQDEQPKKGRRLVAAQYLVLPRGPR